MHSEDRDTDRRLGLLRQVRETGNVSAACRAFGYSRDTYYRLLRIYETEGETGIRGISRCKPKTKNRVHRRVEAAVLDLALACPLLGQQAIATLLTEHGLKVSAFGVRGVLSRHGLLLFERRCEALRRHLAQTGAAASPLQADSLERETAIQRGEGKRAKPNRAILTACAERLATIEGRATTAAISPDGPGETLSAPDGPAEIVSLHPRPTKRENGPAILTVDARGGADGCGAADDRTQPLRRMAGP